MQMMGALMKQKNDELLTLRYAFQSSLSRRVGGVFGVSVMSLPSLSDRR
jgi:hypothetical protein